MISKDQLERVLRAGVCAPSGDNVQPWKFEWDGDALYVINDPTRDTSLYNVKQLASFIAHGALLENIGIAAAHEGFLVEEELFPQGKVNEKKECIVARIVFHEGTLQEGDTSLFSYIKERATNRNPYSPAPLVEDFWKSVPREVGIDGVRLIWVTDEEKRNSLARYASVNERVVFENQFLHSFLFQHVYWPDEDGKREDGFSVKTFELPRMGELFFKISRNWDRLKYLNRFMKFSQFVSRENEKLYRSGGVMGAFVVEAGANPHYAVYAGKTLQKIWLTASKFQAWIQPITGIPLLAMRFRTEGSKHFSSFHRSLIQDAYTSMGDVLSLSQNEFLFFLFRLGKAERNPSARTFRRAPRLKSTKI